ncbi:MAG: glycosyltransferase [Kiritimatiellia bacterium]|jgi:glycosyltransferase involved in cell wall biosynthesis
MPRTDLMPGPEALAAAAHGETVALGHDWLTGMRGGERVLECLCHAFPGASISTLIYNPAAISELIRSHPVQASFLNRLPGVRRHYRMLLPIMPLAARSLPRPDGKLLITTSHCVAKSFRKPAGGRHLCICFTPMRYAWTFFEEYFGRSPVKAALVKPLLAALRHWDRRSAAEVDLFVAISRHVASRIERFYGRSSEIVHPAVDIDRCTPSPDGACRGDYDLIVSALVPYKRVDLAVELYSQKGWPLKVVGTGGCEAALRRAAGPSVEILGRLSDEAVLDLYRNCRLLVFPGEEDYGIVPLEAQACGRPVVAYAKGGALETVADGVTGVFFDEQTHESLEDAVVRCAEATFDPAAIRAHAERFGPAQFYEGLAACVEKALA